MFQSLFKLREPLRPRTRFFLEIFGLLFLLLIWYLLTVGAKPIVTPGILPKPIDVLKVYRELIFENELFTNLFRSLGLNLAGYLESMVLALPIGFVIGLWPFFRGSFQRGVDAIRFVPLTAVTGLFLVWFGLGTAMKVHFLAFGIFIYLLPVIVQRIDEVQSVYLKTVYTLGATDWQMIRTVYIPSAISRLSDDIRVLTAISWTYIIIAEMKGNQGGIGALLWRVGERQGRVDKVFAILLLIIFIGILQDKLFTYLDKEFFPYKYQTKKKYQRKETELTNILGSIWDYAVTSLMWIFIIAYVVLLINEFVPIFNSPVLTTLFGDTQWAVTLVVLSVLGYKSYKLFRKFGVRQPSAVPA